MSRNVAVIVGSLRKESFSRKLANALIPLSKPALDLKLVEIRDLELYNEDTEKNPTPAWVAFRDAIRPVDAVLFVTPEYNRSVPGCLKNAIDVGSRPYGSSVWSGKPACVISNSPGVIGGFGANHHLRQSLVFLDMPVLQQPEAYISGSNKLVGDDGKIIEDAKREFLAKVMTSFANWIETTAKR
ncbi:MAG TPA: NADPH-dependent FMN reductase [Rhizomicrobium sp.]|nr:NADPH-dependent FMN reductase [Rhizomicrobium sp.]